MILFAMVGVTACAEKENFEWTIDRFDDVKIIRYKVPGFEKLPLEQKMLVYYLSEAALCGRDIIFDQNCRYNLMVRRTLEAIYAKNPDASGYVEWDEFVKYTKKVWFANGIHHHYSGDKFAPGFTQTYFKKRLAGVRDEDLPLAYMSRDAFENLLDRLIFEPGFFSARANKATGVDLLATSAMNYYEGVSQEEAEKFYAAMVDPTDPTPISYGLNSKLGRSGEKVWRVGEMYGDALSQVVAWLEKAREVAEEPQKEIIGHLINYYVTGDLREFDKYNVAWVRDTESNVDFVNGFIETYGDPLGVKASWEANVNFVDLAATRRAQIISENAQWFEDNSPVDPRFRKPVVKGVSAKVITVAAIGGDCYPATPIGINLPNADWIRRDHGSKSVTIQNITDAYDAAAKGNGSREEFVLRAEDRRMLDEFGSLGGNLHTDLHECLGHGSGQLAPGVTGGELKQYSSVIEEMRADLFALYYIADPKMIELGLVPSDEVAKAEYVNYFVNGLMIQLARVAPGKTVEEAHMRNRQAIARWCAERGGVKIVTEGGKKYVVVDEFEKLRGLVGELLAEIQRIKSEGDFEAGRAIVEKYGVQVDQFMHEEVLTRYNALNLAPYGGFVNPRYELVREGDRVVDVRVSYDESYLDQMMRYSRDYSFLPTHN